MLGGHYLCSPFCCYFGYTMKLIKPNWYGLDHSAVATTFEGNPKFINDFCITGSLPYAVYYVDKPNKRKKHKKYMLLWMIKDQLYIGGISAREIGKFRKQDAMHCLSCDEVIYSVTRYDNRSCSCGKVSIDGGKDYTKVSFGLGASYRYVTVDLLTDAIYDAE